MKKMKGYIMVYKKRTLLLSLVLLLSFALPAQAAGAADIQDIRGHWAECQMAWAREHGVLTGTSPTALSPDGVTTRAMAVAILYRYAGSPAADGSLPFVDVPSNAYYANGLVWAVQEGIAAGTSQTTFCPDKSISKEDFTVMLYRLCSSRHGVPDPADDALDNQTDAAEIHAYAKEAMAWAVDDLVLVNKNLPGSVLSPRAPMSRAEAVHLLRQYDCLVEGHPAQLYHFDPDSIQKIAFSLQEETFSVTDPSEIQRFVETINGFSYTGQHTPAGAGGWAPFCATLWFKTAGILPQTLFISPNGIGEYYIVSPDQPYFTAEWFQSFQPDV